jgi:hypothetical protein
MSKPIMFSEADQALMVAVLRQIGVGKLNYEILQHELGLTTEGAARVRWSRLNSKLKKSVGGSVIAAKEEVSTMSKGNLHAGGVSKKCKSSNGETEENHMVKVDNIGLGVGGWQKAPRRIPEREKRAKKFKEETSEDEGLEIFEDSDHGRTPSEKSKIPSEGA